MLGSEPRGIKGEEKAHAEEKMGLGQKCGFHPGDGNVDRGIVIFIKTQQMLLDVLLHIFLLLKKSANWTSYSVQAYFS
jgi:hypothetical protein